MPTPFAATTEEMDGPIHAISVVGELDLDTAPVLEARLREAREADASVLLNLSDCEFIDSSGLALIVQAWRDLENREGTGLAMCCATDQVERLLRIAGAYEAISITDSVDEALAELR
ncbi:MAG: STAS domain-containing protein [Solirubrobacterales bacterium]|nr:STAS domain-containing protein [Solirubrobacterales bacterium]